MKKKIIQIKDILDSQRVDVAYFMNDFRGNNFVSLSKYVNIRGGKRIPKGESFSFEKTNFLYLRLSDITDFDNIDSIMVEITKFYPVYEDSDVRRSNI